MENPVSMPSRLSRTGTMAARPAARPVTWPGASLPFPFELQARLLDAQTMPDLLEIATSMLARVPGTIGAWFLQRDASGTLLLVRQWQAHQTQVTALPSADLGTVIHQRWIAAHRLGHSAAEFARPFVLPGYPSALVAPMLIGEELIGAIVVERRDGLVYPYAPEDIVALTAIAALTAQGMQMIILRQRVADIDRDEARQELIEQERRRIGRELHDGAVQDLAYLRLKLEMLERVIPDQPQRAQEEARQLTEQVNQSIAKLREAIGELRRPRGPKRGITGQLRDLASTMSDAQRTLELDLAELRGVRLAPEVERAVVGIVREALQNIRKHANASSVRVEVQREDEDLHLIVADDGVGIDREAVPVEGHFGVEQMRELAEDMGGAFVIESTPAGGTRVHAMIPLGQGAQEQP